MVNIPQFDDVSETTRAAIARVRTMESEWINGLPTTPLPEFGIKLNLADIGDNRPRLVKRIHQACSIHLEHFRSTNAAKVAYLLRGFLSMVDSRNIYGLYYFTRAGLELLAFLNEIRTRTTTIAERSNDNLIGKGQEFFTVVVRARYATSNPDLSAKLKEAGLSNECLKPFNIMNCLKTLAASQEYGSFANRYEALCDVVHHNASSHAAGTVGIIQGAGVVNAVGGAILTSKSGPIAVYNFPVVTKEAEALDITVPLFHKLIESVVEVQNALTIGPFSTEFLVRETGNRYGMQIGHNPAMPRSVEELTAGYKPRYNDLCPCGSTLKYKQCCLNRRHIGADE